jgi:hypothetical protein
VHRLMLADSPRTMAYQKAIEGNADFFKGKTVMGEPIHSLDRFSSIQLFERKGFFSNSIQKCK